MTVDIGVISRLLILLPETGTEQQSDETDRTEKICLEIHNRKIYEITRIVNDYYRLPAYFTVFPGLFSLYRLFLNIIDKIIEIKLNPDGAGFIFFYFCRVICKKSDYENIGCRYRVCWFGFRDLPGGVGHNGDMCGCQ